MDLETVKWFSTLGVGGVLAGAMFLFYRHDSASWTKRETARGDTMTKIVQENTEAITSLINYLKSNGQVG